jgi:hypothetical protein
LYALQQPKDGEDDGRGEGDEEIWRKHARTIRPAVAQEMSLGTCDPLNPAT